ncbi:MAG: hypothetical protein K9K76_01170 [Halanaerobiales bacterium]|nr:hypothetical protein [Halanaerobiales bacterium]
MNFMKREIKKNEKSVHNSVDEKPSQIGMSKNQDSSDSMESSKSKIGISKDNPSNSMESLK